MKTVKKILNEEPNQQIYKKKFLKPAEKLALDCFIETDLLWARRRRYGEQRTVLMVPEDMKTTLLEGIHGHMLYGHEGQFKTKERILQSYWWKGMDQDTIK